jgi:hypothetical protein
VMVADDGANGQAQKGELVLGVTVHLLTDA